LDIRQLRYFMAIAAEGSLSAAAKRLGMSQPSLSQQLAVLESELGVELLARSSRGVVPTPAGEVLLAHARELVFAMDRTVDAVRQAGRLPQGEVVFGMPSSVSMVLSVPLAETARLDLPGVRLRSIEAMSGFIRSWLEDRSIDLGILYDPDPAGQLDCMPLVSEALHFFSAPDAWPFSSPPGSAVRLADLAGVELIMPSAAHGLRAMVDRVAQEEGIGLTVMTEMDALAQIKTMVARGSGYTILSPAAAMDFVGRGELVMAPIVQPCLARRVYLVRNSSRPPTPASQEVERLVRSVVRDLVRRGLWQAQDAAPEVMPAHLFPADHAVEGPDHAG